MTPDQRLARLRQRAILLRRSRHALHQRRQRILDRPEWPRPDGRARTLREIARTLIEVDQALFLTEARLDLWRWAWADEQAPSREAARVGALIEKILDK